jgi:serine kinase of HPr protein (carbohydrate metabolism regulator)
MRAGSSIHANCVLLGEAGVLIRGASGAGKSSLSETLIAAAEARGLFARLVADDRTLLERANGRLIASAPAVLAGLIERRGFGIVKIAHAEAAIVRLVVDIEAEPPRMPVAQANEAQLEGIVVPRVAAPKGEANQAVTLVFGALESFWRRCCGRSPLAFAAQHGKLMVSAPVCANLWEDVRHNGASEVPDPERNEFCAETA